MSVEERIIAFLAFLVTWTVTAVGVSKYVGKTDQKTEDLSGRVEVIEQSFVNADGEPRLLSVTAFNNICRDRQLAINSKLSDQDKRLAGHDEKLDRILEGITDLKVGVASIKKES